MKILMPQLGETVNEGTIGVWHKKIGDTVKKDEALLDVETDKAAVEVPVPEDGVITSIMVEAGDTVDVGTVLAIIEIEGEDAQANDSIADSSDDNDAASTGLIGKNILMPQRVRPLMKVPLVSGTNRLETMYLKTMLYLM